MKHSPDRHRRKSIRLKDYDYSQAGAYFVTVCTQNRKLYFEQYPKLKEIVNQQWQKIPDKYPNIQLDEFIIMPNHIHGIIIIIQNVGATLAVAQEGRAGARSENRAGARPAPTIGEIVGTFKSLCVREWLKCIKENRINAVGKFWQRNYYEHIIRNEKELDEIREYISGNPMRWESDEENPDVYMRQNFNPRR